MNDLIEKILKADEEARRVSHAVEEKRANLEAEISKEKARIKDKYMHDADGEIKKQLTAKKKAADDSWNEASKKYKKIGDDLSSAYSLNCDKWANEIADRVLEGYNDTDK